MAEHKVTRRLSAIFAADIVGYSRLMEADEEGTIARQKAHREELIDPKIAEHDGRIVKLMGDGMLVEFASVVDAVRCAVEVQQAMQEREAEVAEERRIVYRIGVNLGDIVIEGDDILGDGVNVAARLEALANPGEVLISGTVFDHLKKKLKYGYHFRGERKVKNIADPVRIYGVLPDSDAGTVLGRHRLSTTTWAWVAGAALLLLIVAAAGIWFALQPGSKPSGARASVAVLPFANLSGDPQQEYFSKGITQDILTELARVPGLFVPAGNSSSRYKGASVDLKQVGRELGVRYVLEGSVQKSGNQVRVTAQLVEIANGSQAWAQRYDRPLDDLFAVQDEITRAISTRLVAEIKQLDLQVAKRKPTAHMDAYDLVLKGRWLMAQTNPKDNAEAKRLYEKAIAHDPNYADAYAGLVGVYTRGFLFGWGDLTGQPALDKAIELGQRSLALDPSRPFGAYNLALPYLFRRRLDEAEAVLTQAHAAYPNDADIMDRLGVTYVFQGRHRKGANLLERVLKVDPFHRRAIFALTARAFVMLKDYDKAAEQLKRCYVEAPKYRVCYEVAAVHYVETGDIDKAREAVVKLREIQPTFTLTTAPKQLPFKNQADRDRFLDAFRKAGMPE